MLRACYKYKVTIKVMPMKLYCEGEIVLSQSKTFDDKEGQEVTYYENTVVSDDGSIKLNSKAEFKETGIRGVITVDAQQLYYENGTVKGFKLVLRDFKAGFSMPEQEGEVS